MDEPAVHALGQALGLPVRFFDPPALEALTPRLANPSATVFRAVGCHGVAEAAALAAAGRRGTLRVAKTKSRRATCAIAEAPAPIDAGHHGRARGVLTVVGLGPGAPDWRTPASDRAIRGATHLVGYRGYLDMAPACAGQVRHVHALGEETQRVDQALALAAEGHRVALICSGDPGVYAMAALVFERLEATGEPRWRRSEIVVLPGVSAMHGAAALAGAPLGHDFCAISLSDLLTPWAVIEQRLGAAADGDFVVALYNPASNRRRRGLARAIDILASKRPPTTPVVVARAIGREEQSLTVTCLRDLDQTPVDMMTLLIIGSTETRVTDGHVYTPRGYRAKRSSEESPIPLPSHHQTEVGYRAKRSSEESPIRDGAPAPALGRRTAHHRHDGPHLIAPSRRAGNTSNLRLRIPASPVSELGYRRTLAGWSAAAGCVSRHPRSGQGHFTLPCKVQSERAVARKPWIPTRIEPPSPARTVA